MKKAASITGIIFTSFILLGCLFRILKWPGASILTVYGSFLFIVVFQILLVIYQLRLNTSQLIKSAHIVGLFAGWTLITGLMYQVQHWPGGNIQALIGLAMSGLFLLLFFLGRAKDKENTPGFNIFTVLFSLVIISLLINRQFSDSNKASLDAKVREYLEVIPHEKELAEKNNTPVLQYFLDSTQADKIVAKNFAGATEDIVNYLDKVKFEIIAETDRMDPSEVRQMPPENYSAWDNYDIPTHYLVGSDPQDPTGKGAELFIKLKKYKNEILAENIPLNIDLSETIERDGEKMTWVGANFYHKPLVEMLLTFNKIKVAIWEAENKSFESKTFRK